MDLRCFISVELPEEIRNNIGARTESLVAAGADVKWIPPENLHLTLKFLGKTPEELVPDIRKKLLEAASLHHSIRIRLSGTGVFPDRRRPRVIWVGMQDSEGLVKLQQDIEAKMAELGFEAEKRRFSPHLTIGRVRSPKGRENLLRELDALRDMDFNELEVRDVSMMKSELRPTGARHFKLFDIPLGHV
jgi:2'-5' RNA ligase